MAKKKKEDKKLTKDQSIKKIETLKIVMVILLVDS